MTEISYIKTNWVNNVTKLNADNMNHIENGIEALDTALGNKLDKSDVVQTTGQSTTEVMSQKAVTDELNGKANKADLEQTSAKLDALWKLNEGISYDFVTTAGSFVKYPSDVPNGGKYAAIEKIGGNYQQVEENKEVNGAVTSVKVRGTNMFDEDLLLTATGWTKENGVYTGKANNIYNPNILSSLVFESNTQYYISYNVTQIDAKNFRVLITYTDGTKDSIYNSGITKSGKTVSKMEFGFGNNGTVELSNIIIAKSSVAVDYVPYHIETYPIPSSVQNLDGYGWATIESIDVNINWISNAIERTDNGWQYAYRVEAHERQDGRYNVIVRDTPIITDITDLMADFPKIFAVESRGAIIFENNAKIDVLGSIKYLRSLAEVKK